MLRYQATVPAPWWFRLLLWLIAAALAVGGIAVLVSDPHPAASLVTGVGLLIFAALWVGLVLTFSRITIRVETRRIHFGFGPIGRTVQLSDVASVEVERYPWLRFAGWGIRMSFGRRWAYSLPGYPSGVLLRLRNGTSYHLSHGDPQQLRSVLQELIGTDQDSPPATSESLDS